MRIFVALDLDSAIRERIARFMEGVRGFAPDAKWVTPASLHVTLKFIGEQPPERVEEIQRDLAAIKAPPLGIAFRGYGFFPSPRSARVFWVGIHAGPELELLARNVEDVTARFGIEREERYAPHLTLARARPPQQRGGPLSAAARSLPARRGVGSSHLRASEISAPPFARVQERLAALPQPEFGTMTAQEFCLFESKLSPKGAQYTKIGKFPLNR